MLVAQAGSVGLSWLLSPLRRHFSYLYTWFERTAQLPLYNACEVQIFELQLKQKGYMVIVWLHWAVLSFTGGG